MTDVDIITEATRLDDALPTTVSRLAAEVILYDPGEDFSQMPTVARNAVNHDHTNSCFSADIRGH